MGDEQALRIAVWAFIRDYIESQGQSPDDAEIADFFERDLSSIREHLYFLARDGYISFSGGKICMILPGFSLRLHREIRDVPGAHTIK